MKEKAARAGLVAKDCRGARMFMRRNVGMLRTAGLGSGHVGVPHLPNFRRIHRVAQHTGQRMAGPCTLFYTAWKAQEVLNAVKTNRHVICLRPGGK